jgi:hypothetical protein
MSGAMDGTVLVQLVPTEDGGEIGWGSSRLASLTGRAEQIEGAMRGGMAVAAAALSSLPDPGDWRVESVETAFGIALTAEGSVLLTKAEVGTTFEVTVTWARTDGR